MMVEAGSQRTWGSGTVEDDQGDVGEGNVGEVLEEWQPVSCNLET